MAVVVHYTWTHDLPKLFHMFVSDELQLQWQQSTNGSSSLLCLKLCSAKSSSCLDHPVIVCSSSDSRVDTAQMFSNNKYQYHSKKIQQSASNKIFQWQVDKTSPIDRIRRGRLIKAATIISIKGLKAPSYAPSYETHKSSKQHKHQRHDSPIIWDKWVLPKKQ